MKVTATGTLNGHEITADVINPGGWWGKVWLIEVGCGFSSSFFVVEAGNESNVIDEFTDSEYGHLIKVAEKDKEGYVGRENYGGNACEMVDLENVRIHQIPLIYKCDRIPNGVKAEDYSGEIEILDEIDSYKVVRYKDIPKGFFSLCVNKKDLLYMTYHKISDGSLRINLQAPHVDPQLFTVNPDPNSLWFLCEDYEYRQPA